MDSDWVALAPQGAALTNRNNREFPSHFAGKVLMRRPDYGGAQLGRRPKILADLLLAALLSLLNGGSRDFASLNERLNALMR
jgi:hypothetical protein